MQQRRWVEFLQEFTFEIQFELGKENQVVDALGKRVAALAISLVSTTLPKEIQQKVLTLEFFGPLITKIHNKKNSRILEDYTLKEGLLFFKDHLSIPIRLRGQIPKEAHKSPLAAH